MACRSAPEMAVAFQPPASHPRGTLIQELLPFANGSSYCGEKVNRLRTSVARAILELQSEAPTECRPASRGSRFEVRVWRQRHGRA